MKKMMSSMLVLMLFVGGIGFRLPSTVYADHLYCDNDAVGYPCSNSFTESWTYRSGYSGDQNGDHRLARNDSSSSYLWRYDDYVVDPYLDVWLNNYDFTNPNADYYVSDGHTNVQYVGDINQNTAPGGWNGIGKVYGWFIDADVFQRGDYPNSYTGADMIRLYDPSTLAMNTVKEQTYHANAEIASIQKKMLNAIDHYQNIQGSFHIQFENNGQNETIDFQVDEGKTPGSHVKVTKANGTVFETKSNGKEHLVMNHQKEQFSKSNIAPRKEVKGSRHFSNENGQPVFVQRNDPATASIAKEVTFPQNYAFWLRNKENKIVGHDKMFNRDITVIEGKHNDYLSKKLGATTYKMWVDTKTGVLLKLIGTDRNGDEAYHIKVQDIQFNQGVNTQQFAPVVPKDWEKMKEK